MLVPSNTPPSPPSPDELRRYQAIAENPKYGHFARIPARIMRCLDHFQMSFDRETVRQRLLSHYLFIAVVDEAIDCGQPHVAEIIFDCLDRPTSRANEISSTFGRSGNDVSTACVSRWVKANLNMNSSVFDPSAYADGTDFDLDETFEAMPSSDVLLVTEILKRQIDNDIYSELHDRLRQAYQKVCDERAATSIAHYIEHRKALGRLTAEQSYLVIRSALNEGNEELCRLMQDVGAVGCLVDSVIDLRHDSRRGLLNFKPTLFAYAKLWFSTAIEGLRVWIRKPSLSLLFLEAVIDDIHDGEGVRASRNEQPIVTENEGRAAIVA